MRYSTSTSKIVGQAARMTDQALEALQDGVGVVRDNAPSAMSRAALRVDELTRRSIDRARDVGNDVRDQVGRAGDRTVSYIQDEPVKSVLVAAAAGAVAAALFAWWTRPRERD